MINSNIPNIYNYIYFKTFLANYMERISDILENSFNEENVQGSSNYWKVNQQFIFAYLFGQLVKNRMYYGETLEEVEATFNMDTIRIGFTRNHIDLDIVYSCFNIAYS